MYPCTIKHMVTRENCQSIKSFTTVLCGGLQNIRWQEPRCYAWVQDNSCRKLLRETPNCMFPSIANVFFIMDSFQFVSLFWQVYSYLQIHAKILALRHATCPSAQGSASILCCFMTCHICICHRGYQQLATDKSILTAPELYRGHFLSRWTWSFCSFLQKWSWYWS
jgi:hypothetical protein